MNHRGNWHKKEDGWERTITRNGQGGARISRPPAISKAVGLRKGDVVQIDTGERFLERGVRLIPKDAIVLIPKKYLAEQKEVVDPW